MTPALVEAAVRHLESALERHEHMEAKPFAAMTKHLLAGVLRTPGPHGDEARAQRLQEEAAVTAAALAVPRAISDPKP